LKTKIFTNIHIKLAHLNKLGSHKEKNNVFVLSDKFGAHKVFFAFESEESLFQWQNAIQTQIDQCLELNNRLQMESKSKQKEKEQSTQSSSSNAEKKSTILGLSFVQRVIYLINIFSVDFDLQFDFSRFLFS